MPVRQYVALCDDANLSASVTATVSSPLYTQRVLVPGAGLGRLVLEIAALGYGAEGNEFSYQMLFASNYMLNATHAGCDIVHPYVDTTCNHVTADDMVK